MPAENTEQRKLAAIMFTDMVGYSALSQRNEKLAQELLEEHRALLRPLFPRFNGTEIKTIGDAFLVEFHSALEAAQCGIEIQRALAKRNTDAPADHRIEIRIGIHIGDVVHRGGDVYGDGVNIASRIEPLAGAGGICVSMDVERQIRNALEARFEKLAPTELKNISVTMDLFRIILPWETQSNSRREEAHSERGTGIQSLVTSAAARFAWVAALLLAAGGLGWWLVHQSRQTTKSLASSPSPAKAAGRITSLAVKPFDDFSGDTNNAYLSDGMTEALCAALGNVSALRVPGRSSVMRYKGGQKSIPEMARELNVEAIVEGSVQRTTTNMLVTVQLIEAGTDRHLWATNYKRDLSDFFVVQSEVARAVANEVQARLTPEDQARLARAHPANREAIEACLLGMHHLWKVSDEGFTNALKHFQEAIQIDPNHAFGYAGAALAYVQGADWWLWPSIEAMPKARSMAQRAIDLDPALAEGYMARGTVRLNFDWDWPGAQSDLKQAIKLRPGSSQALDFYAGFLLARGQTDEAIAILKKALEIDPLSPALNSDLGWAYFNARKIDRAIPSLLKALELDRNFFQAHYWLGWSLMEMGKTAEALTEFQTLLKIDPNSVMARSALGYTFGVTGQRADAIKVIEDLDRLATKRYVTRNSYAFTYLGLGQKEAALDWLEKAYEERDPQMPSLKVDLGNSSLANEPRFQALVKKVENGGRDK